MESTKDFCTEKLTFMRYNKPGCTHQKQPKTLSTNCGFVKMAYLCAGSHGSTILRLPDVSQHAYI